MSGIRVDRLFRLLRARLIWRYFNEPFALEVRYASEGLGPMVVESLTRPALPRMASHPTHPNDEKSWLTKQRFWVWLVAFVIGLVFVFTVLFYFSYVLDVPLEISPETTYITEPLMADGTRVDYFAAIEQIRDVEGMNSEENGFRLLIQEMGVAADTTPEESLQIYDQLGLDPKSAMTVTYEEPDSVLHDYVDAEEAAGRLPSGISANTFRNELSRQLDQPWTREQLPMMADWLDRNTAVLDVVVDAVRRPTFIVPLPRTEHGAVSVGAVFNAAARMRPIVRWLEARTRFRLGTGDVDGAIDDIIACARLGRHLQDSGFTFDHVCGIAFEATAVGLGAGSSLEHQPTEAQWLRLLDEWNRLPNPAPITESFEIDRLVVLDVMQSVAHGDMSLISSGEYARILQSRNFGIDWNIVMRRINENHENWLLGHPIARVEAAALEEFHSRGMRSQLVADVFYAPSGAHQRTVEIPLRALHRENLFRIVLAMLIYEKQHGTLPPAYTVDDHGNPLHSWRVLLLPYLGHDEIYAEIRLDEPWDSAHNLAFHTVVVPVYQSPSAALGPGETTYTVVEGATCAFDGSEGKHLEAFGPHSANLVLVAERLDAICWMDPTQEVPFAEARLGVNRSGATTGLGSNEERGAHFGFRSGAVKQISENIDTVEWLPGMLEGTIEYVP